MRGEVHVSLARGMVHPRTWYLEPYATGIRAGPRHPRPQHWQTLARLTGASPEAQ